MKKTFLCIILAACSLTGWAQQQDYTLPASAVQAPELEFVMQLRVNIGAPVWVGETPAGKRQSIPITGGTFEGPRLRGTVLAGGADYQLIQKDKNNLEAIYNIRTDDGVNIHVRNIGVIGQDEGRPYFFTAPHFEAPQDSPYAWLNLPIYVCRPGNESIDGGIVLNVWKVR